MTLPSPVHTEPALRRRLVDLLDHGRRRTLELVAPLGAADLHEQFVDFMSPLVWDVGHIASFEELWLVRELTGRPSSDPERDRLYNAFDSPRHVRGELPLLPHDEALRYLADVRTETVDVLRRAELDPEAPLLAHGRVHRMIAQHERQHQETMLQAISLREDLAYGPVPAPAPGPSRPVDDLDRVHVPAGPVVLGTDDPRWSYDNERPAHTVDVPAFDLDRYPVTTRRFAAFVADGGYRRPELWSERGWAWRTEAGASAPLGWLPGGDGTWSLRRFGHVVPLDPRDPVERVSYFEAEAFARWAGARLPTEVEWEKAATWDPRTGRKRTFPWGEAPPDPTRANLDARRLGPVPVGSLPAGRSAYGAEQLAGDVYEWTSSPFLGYPGFRAFPYREYSEVFFGGDYRVLRGSSWAIGAAFARGTYRNWDHPYRRQVFAGLRLAHEPRRGR